MASKWQQCHFKFYYRNTDSEHLVICSLQKFFFNFLEILLIHFSSPAEGQQQKLEAGKQPISYSSLSFS